MNNQEVNDLLNQIWQQMDLLEKRILAKKLRDLLLIVAGFLPLPPAATMQEVTDELIDETSAEDLDTWANNVSAVNNS